jgi:MFS family permease
MPDKLSLSSRINDKIFYGWVILASCLITNTFLVGIRHTFGVFFKSIESEFLLTRLQTSSVASIFMAFSAIFAIISGWAMDRFGPKHVVRAMGLITGISLLLTSQVNFQWQLFITYSFLAAIGTGGAIPVLMSVISRWFDKKRGLALGIGLSGGSIGTIIMAPFSAYLIATLDWRNAYMVLGLLALFVIGSLSVLLRNNPAEIGVLPDGAKQPVTGPTENQSNSNSQSPGLLLSQAFRTGNFWLIFICWLTFAICIALILTHFVPYVTDMGISTMEAASILSLSAVCAIISRLLIGRASDIIGRKVPTIIFIVWKAGSLLWLIWSHEMWMIYVFAVAFGFSWGAIGVTTLAWATDVFHGRNLGITIGALEIGYALGSAIGPAVGGAVFDANNNYYAAFAIGAGAMLLTAVLTVLIGRETIKNTSTEQ